MRRVILTAATSAVATGLLGVPLRAALIRWKLYDVPNSRSSHSTAIPRGGGIAPCVAGAATAWFGGSRPSARIAAPILALGAVGLADDVSGGLSPAARLLAQIANGAVLASGPLTPVGAVGAAGIVNVVNFMDGINGISSGTAVVWGVNAISLASGEDDDLAHLGALALGGALGFLPHNAPEARFFLGDVGSYSLGGLMAAGVLSRRRFADQWLVAAPLLLYGIDAAQAIVHRARTNQPVGVAHRDHIYQRLVDGGWSHNSVAAFHTALAGLVSASHRLPLPWSIAGTASAAMIYLAAPRVSPPHPSEEPSA